jgi:hypothetical protein
MTLFESERAFVSLSDRLQDSVWAFFEILHDDYTDPTTFETIPGWVRDSLYGAGGVIRAQCNYQTRLRHRRFWRNLSSRLLAPGTAYSITYRWSRGVQETNAKEFGTVVARSFLQDSTAGAGIGGTFKPFGINIFDIQFDNRTARRYSHGLSSRFRQERTVTVREAGEVTESVEGVDGMLRVYTVWQLVDEYDFLDDTDGSPTQGDIMDATFFEGCPEFHTRMNNWDVIISVNGTDNRPGLRRGRIIYPSALQHGTNFFVQATTDFPLSSSAAVAGGDAATSLSEPVARLVYFNQPTNR